jgi:flagellum-specific ATP synthase
MTARLDALRADVAALAARARRAAAGACSLGFAGQVTGFDGQRLRVAGLAAAPGALLDVETGAGGHARFEAIGFHGSELAAIALEEAQVRPGARALLAGRISDIAFGPALLGRVVDGLGQPVDGLGAIACPERMPLAGLPLPPLDRVEVTRPLFTGVRAIDGLFTLGQGQRIGLFAGSGVGKSTLLLQLLAGTAADIVVVGLIGERGREIAGFVDRLAPAARARTHVVAVPADHAAPLRLHGANRVFAVAEGFRRQGAQVLLLLDSLTRVAHARRELALAAGEPPGARGYPASALGLIARLAERAGNDRASGGAITAILTVLADGDDLVADPVVDAARGVLDGHLMLARQLAARGRLPAIDLAASISRTMDACVTPQHRAAARALVQASALIEANRDLVAMGAHVPGQDKALDAALAAEGRIEAFVRQPPQEFSPPEASLARLLADWGVGNDA